MFQTMYLEGSASGQQKGGVVARYCVDPRPSACSPAAPSLPNHGQAIDQTRVIHKDNQEAVSSLSSSREACAERSRHCNGSQRRAYETPPSGWSNHLPLTNVHTTWGRLEKVAAAQTPDRTSLCCCCCPPCRSESAFVRRHGPMVAMEETSNLTASRRRFTSQQGSGRRACC